MNTRPGTPKSLRLQIAIFGRTNVGKSSFLNMVAGQDVAITSPVPGTTTDVVEKPMELLPVGPVVFLDTAGLDDVSVLAAERMKKTAAIFDRADIVLLLTEAGVWGEHEHTVAAEAAGRKLPLIVIINKVDLRQPQDGFVATVAQAAGKPIFCSATDRTERNRCIDEIKRRILELCPDDFLRPPPLVGDLLPPGGLAVLVVPIDLEAPKGRIILPQVQTIRDCLDHGVAAVTVRELEYPGLLQRLTRAPDLVVCDSQVVKRMVSDTPAGVPCTTFSILFARLKGDLTAAAAAAAVIDTLHTGDKLLIAEACSHHPLEDDIGRVKLPRWLREHLHRDVTIDVTSGRDCPANLAEYRLVIHCGGCMLNRREMRSRLERGRAAGVAVTNYGVAISLLQGVLERVLSPFPAALDAYEHARRKGAAS